MKTNSVGTTDVAVSELSFGCSSLAGMYKPISDEDARKVVKTAWEQGIRTFDVAPHYGRGRAEQRIGQCLSTKPRSAYQLSTKVGRVLTPGEPMETADEFFDPLPNDVHFDYSGAGIRESFEHSCALLGTDTLDIVYVHDIGSFTHGDVENLRHVKDFTDTGYGVLCELRAQGRIGAFGLGVNEVGICLDLMRDHAFDVHLLAGRWTLLDRSAERKLAETCIEKDTCLILGGIFNSGILATGPGENAHFEYEVANEEIQEKVAAIQTICNRLDVPMPLAALQFALRQSPVKSVILGTSNPSSLIRNVIAAFDASARDRVTQIIEECEPFVIR